MTTTTKTKVPTVQDWNDRMAKVLVGKKIMSVRYMTSKEANEFRWYKRPLIIELSDGTQIIPLQDDEGKDGGSLEFFHPETELEDSGAQVMYSGKS